MRDNNALCSASDFYSYMFAKNNSSLPSTKSLTVQDLQYYSVISYGGSKVPKQCLTYYDVCSYYPTLIFSTGSSYMSNLRLKIKLTNKWKGNITDYCLEVTLIGNSEDTFTFGTSDILSANIQLSNINSNLQNPTNQTPYSNDTSASYSYSDPNSSLRSALGSSTLRLVYNLQWQSGKLVKLQVSPYGNVSFPLNDTGSTITSGVYTSSTPYLSYQCNFYSLNGTPIKVNCPIYITYYIQNLPSNSNSHPIYCIENYIDYITSNANTVLNSNNWQTYLYFKSLPTEAENDTITIYFNSFDSNDNQLKTPDGTYGDWSSSIRVEYNELCYSIMYGPYSIFNGNQNVKASYIRITSVENVSTDYEWTNTGNKILINYS